MKRNRVKGFIIFFLLVAVIVLVATLKGDIFNLKRHSIHLNSNKTDSIIGTFTRFERFNEGYVMLEGVNVKKGFIPDYKTAIKYAELLWLPIYGDKIYKDKPFNACLIADSVWVIYGTSPKNTVGGSFEAMIRKSDGKVLRIVQQK